LFNVKVEAGTGHGQNFFFSPTRYLAEKEDRQQPFPFRGN
jgi:hypothetical protein